MIGKPIKIERKKFEIAQLFQFLTKLKYDLH